MGPELRTWAPLWLEYSGLPVMLGEKIKGGGGWPLLRKIVELDCAVNPQPGTVEISLLDLGARCGLGSAAVRRTALALRKLKLIACFLPDGDEEDAMFRIKVPLPTPTPLSEMRRTWPALFADPAMTFRYLEEGGGDPAAATDDARLQEIVDLYFDAIGVKMNSFVLDELRLIRQRFDIDQVRRMFGRARQNNVRSLHWVVRELVRHRKRKRDGDAKEERKD